MISRKIIYCIMVILSMLFVIFYSKYIPIMLLIELVVLPIILYLIMLCIFKGVTVQIRSEKEYGRKNKDNNIFIYLKNKTIFPLSKADINVVYEDNFGNKIEKIIRASIDGKDYRNIIYSIVPKKCGMIKVYINHIRIYDYFSLFSRKKKLNIEEKLVILPNEHRFSNEIYSYEELVRKESDIYSECEKGDDPSQVFEIREYLQGDKLQRVHWKLSSKYDELMVKDFSKPIVDSTVMLVELFMDKNNSKASELIDLLIETTYSISKYFIEREYPHYLAWYDEKSGVIKRNIYTNEDLISTTKEMLESKIYYDNINAIKDYVALPNSNSKLIYFTTKLDKEVTEEINKTDTANDNKVVLITSLEGKEVAFDSEGNINITIIDIDSFDESLDRLII